MDRYQALEDQIRSELASEGIELLLPIAPDLFLSSSDDDYDDAELACRLPSAGIDPPTWTLDTLRLQFEDAFKIMKTSTLNNHSNRLLYTEVSYFDKLRQQPANMGVSKCLNKIPVSSLSLEEFKETYISQGGTPVLIEGIPEEGNWPAKDRWTDISLFIELYGDIPIKVMEKNTVHGMGRAFNVRIPIALYYDYAMSNKADDPFYGFELDFTEKRLKLLEDYSTPDFFKEDFYNLNERTREFYPNYRHFIIGGERTGTNLHVDPKCTGAWNTLLYGHKKWALFPPGTDEEYINQLQVAAYAKMPAAYWWQDVVTNMKPNLGMIECIQNPGETIFVPAGWWHTVLNLDFTIAITENLLIPETLPRVWPELKASWTAFTDFLEETEKELVGPLSSSIGSGLSINPNVASMYY